MIKSRRTLLWVVPAALIVVALFIGRWVGCRPGVYPFPEPPMTVFERNDQVIQMFGEPSHQESGHFSQAAKLLDIQPGEIPASIPGTQPVLISTWQRRCFFKPIEELVVVSDPATGKVLAAKTWLFFR